MAVPSAAPDHRMYTVELPLCSLHVMEAGSGSPLVIVPATISELENWVDLVRFAGQWFRAYFFELPGHGESTALPQAFTSDLVATVVAQLVDHIGAERFNLMGFSFGGLLAMKTFLLLHERIDRVVLISPCMTKRALRLTDTQRFAAVQFNRLLKMHGIQSQLHRAAQKKEYSRILARFIQLVGKVENRQHLERKLAKMQPSLIEIVSRQLDEILNAEFPPPTTKYETPCHVAMSIRDPLLHYATTIEELRHHFRNLHVTDLYFPFHQPPRPFTLDELNASFQTTVATMLIAPQRSGGF